jgi:hypothetical protein
MSSRQNTLIWTSPKLRVCAKSGLPLCACADGTLAGGSLNAVAQCRDGNGEGNWCALGTNPGITPSLANCDVGPSVTGTSWGCAPGGSDGGAWNYGGLGANCNPYGGGIGEADVNACAFGTGPTG